MKLLLIDESPVLKIGLFYDASEKQMDDWVIENQFKHHILDQVYSGKITKVLDTLDAAFVDIGLSQNGFMRKKELGKFLGLDLKTIENMPVSSMVKPGDLIFAKVSKEAFQSKGMQLSADIAIKGNHLVFLPYSKGIKFSRKAISNINKEEMILAFEELTEKGYGFILRTAASSNVEDVISEAKDLVNEWEKKTHYSKLGRKIECLYELNGFWEKIKEGLYKNKPDKIFVADIESKKQLEYLGVSSKIISVKTVSGSLFSEHNLPLAEVITQNHFENASGLSITVDELEAFVIVDVNSGRWISHEATALNVNKSAAELIKKILILKGLSGVVLIDFIDLKSEDRNRLAQYLEKHVFKSEEGYSLYGFTKLGLFEVLKKRDRASVKDLLCCNYRYMDLMYWHLNELYYDLKRIANHTRTKNVTVEVETNMYQFLSQNYIFNSLALDVKIKHQKINNKNYKIINIDKHVGL